MKKYEGFEKVEAFTGDYEVLEPGGYVCKILKVVSEENDYGTLLRIAFDIAEGEKTGYVKRLFEKRKESFTDAKYPNIGMYYQTIRDDETSLKYFKGFTTAIEKSNNGFKWDWDEQKLVGKLFGGIFGQEEYESQGEIKLATKCRFVRSVEQIREGNFKIPDIKKLKKSNSNYGDFQTVDTTDDLPF